MELYRLLLRISSGLPCHGVICWPVVGLWESILHLRIHARLWSTWRGGKARLPARTFNPDPLPPVRRLNGLLLALRGLALRLGLRTIALLLCLSRADR